MTQGGDAAEQIVRLSLEGMEVAVKISGESAKNIALILMAVLREEHWCGIKKVDSLFSRVS